jgi:molybdopterin-guanine dinucleotide biosynthesis protein A
MRILGVIIAGGRSSRMGGREKAFIDLNGATLMERVYSRIRFQVDEVVINANGDAARFSAFDLTVIADQHASLATPLAGLHAALAHAQSHGFDAVLTIPSDQPFLPLDLVKRLEEAGRSTGAAVAASMARIHYLTGLWSSALAPVLDDCIRREAMRRVQDFVHRVATAEVEWDVFPHDPFLNVNSVEDLVMAQTVLDQ